ncbi:hypothetical protein R9C00_08490 [Flammeovirgaceae bacterium SG7u.111]|nr:hypothetical protein [Flammeovirgaceae bacterium SG7u.132]WPO37485.1 hypothetical protein R9C00_08490 [Flammeovirgaceae bacterium SG7u.111]
MVLKIGNDAEFYLSQKTHFNGKNQLNPVLATYFCRMKSILMVVAMVLGVLFPIGSQLTFMVSYLVMIMLFLAFLDMQIHKKMLMRSHLWVLLANIGVAFLFYFIILPFHTELAVTAFITGIMPTAAAAPVITGYLKGRVEYVTISVIVTSIGVALIVPFAIPSMVQTTAPISIEKVLFPVFLLVFTPLFLARFLRALPSKVIDTLRPFKKASFYCFLLNIYIATAKATDFVTNQPSGTLPLILGIALVTLLICILNFAFGSKLGEEGFSLETSQALGRKNTMFSVWLALTFISPMAALGPMIYILWHNVYNSYQMYQLKRSGRTLAEPSPGGQAT